MSERPEKSPARERRAGLEAAGYQGLERQGSRESVTAYFVSDAL